MQPLFPEDISPINRVDNLQKVKETLLLKSVKQRINILSFILGTGVEILQNSTEMSDLELQHHFNFCERANLYSSLQKVQNLNILFPIDVVLNNVKQIYVARSKLNKNDLLSTFSVIGDELLSGFKTDKASETNTVYEIMWKSLRHILDHSGEESLVELKMDTLIDDAINTIAPKFNVDLPLHMWRKTLKSVHSSLIGLKYGVSNQPNNNNVKFIVDVLRKANYNTDQSIEDDCWYAFKMLTFIDNTVCYNYQFAMESINVMDDDELVLYSADGSSLDEPEHFENLAKVMVNTITAFHSDLDELHRSLANQESVGMEDTHEVIQKILELLQKHMGVVFAAVLSLIVAIGLWRLRKNIKNDIDSWNEKIQKCRELASELGFTKECSWDEIKRRMDSDLSYKPTAEDYAKVNTAGIFGVKFTEKHRNKLSDLIINHSQGYTYAALQSTLDAHVEALRVCLTDIMTIENHLNKIYENHLTDARQTANVVKEIRTTFFNNDFHLLHYTRTPLYKFIQHHNGSKPWDDSKNEDMKRTERTVTFTPGDHDRFWTGTFSPSDTLTNTIHPYSYPKKVATTSSDLLKKAEEFIEQYVGKPGGGLDFNEKSADTETKSVTNGINLAKKNLTELQKKIITNSNTTGVFPICWPESSIGNIQKTTTAELTTAAVCDNIIKSHLIISGRLAAVGQIAMSMSDVRTTMAHFNEIIHGAKEYRIHKLNDIETFKSMVKKDKGN
jgi:hypothetical protein